AAAAPAPAAPTAAAVVIVVAVAEVEVADVDEALAPAAVAAAGAGQGFAPRRPGIVRRRPAGGRRSRAGGVGSAPRGHVELRGAAVAVAERRDRGHEHDADEQLRPDAHGPIGLLRRGTVAEPGEVGRRRRRAAFGQPAGPGFGQILLAD